ncbi:MAG TPA: RDD family protein [Rhodothermales bacterium]|nr:RDD family protein [Rhodothermales bacterium]
MEPPVTPPPVAPPMGAPAASGYAKADPVKRFAAVFIDGLIASIPAYIFSAIFAMFGMRGIGLGLIYLVGGAYILVRDGLSYDFADGRSVGKKLMKLRPVRLDGGAMTMEVSIRRNWPLAAFYFIYGLAALAGGASIYAIAGLLGIVGWVASLFFLVEGVFVLTDAGGRRFGDKFANTQVIDAGS